MKKVVGPGTVVEPVRVGGSPGLWVAGDAHFLYFGPGGGLTETPIAVRGNVLLWQRDGLTLRLQGTFDRAQTMRIADAVR
jgi:hypothetical protein